MSILPRTIVIFAVLAVFLGLANSQTFTGRITSSFYTYERSDTIDATTTQARGYQSFQFDFGNSDVKFRTYGQLDGDFNSSLAGDGKLRMYNLYLQWKNIADFGEIKFGRQPIFSGVAVGTIDGAQIKIEPSDWLMVKGFGGGLMPDDLHLKVIDEADKNFMAGGQVLVTPITDLSVNLSYYNKKQQRPGYNALRADSIGNVFTQFVETSDRAFEFASLDASYDLGQSTFIYGRSDYDLLSDEITRAEFSVRTNATSKLRLNGSYTYRSPSLPWNSIFAFFNVEDNHEVEGGFYYTLKRSLRFYGNAAGIFYSDDESLRLTLGIDTQYGSFNYVRRSGFAGDLDGLNASFYYPLQNGDILPTVQLSWASYLVDRLDLSSASAATIDRESLFAGAAGLLWRPVQAVTLDSQVQLLHNRYYSDDLRFLFRLQYWFFENLSRN